MKNTEQQQDYIIRIVGNDGEFLQITDLQNKYKGKIYKSLIEDNHFEMMDPKIYSIAENCYNVGKSCFEYWLKKDIEAEAKRIRTEQFNLFYPNITLFVKEENQKMILSNPNYYSIVAPENFYRMSYIYDKRTKITLGELLQIWENEPVFSTTCKKCKGKSVVYFFGGSPLSGTMFEAENICVECGNRGNGAGTHIFNALWKTRLKYKSIEPVAEKPDTIESLVKTCKWGSENKELVEDDKMPKNQKKSHICSQKIN